MLKNTVRKVVLMLSMYQIRFGKGLFNTLLCCLGIGAASVAMAEESHSKQKLKVHGFISQGVIDVNGSDFVNDDGKPSFELTEVGINASYTLSDNFRIAGQLAYLDGGNRYSKNARIDYLLLDWSLLSDEQWKVDLYLGRFKNYNWLYSSTRDIPFTRPTIILPQSIYFDGFRDIAVGGDGASMIVSRSHDEYGDFDFNLSLGVSKISDRQKDIILSEFATGDMEHDEDYQASLYWQPSFSQWRFGVALLDSKFTYDRGASDNFYDALIVLQRYFFNATYEGEFWEFNSEILQERFVLDGFYFPGFARDTFGQGGFVQARYKVTEGLKLLARAEKYFANKDDKSGSSLPKNPLGPIPEYFGYQHDFTLGFSYDLSENLRLQVEHHWVRGTARLTPVVLPNLQTNNQEHWQMTAAQLMYWF